MGFQLFGKEHIAMLTLIAALTASVVVIYARHQKLRHGMLLVIAFLLPILETVKILLLIRWGLMGIGYLPLHLCSLAIYLYPVAALLKQGKTRNVIGGFCCIVLLPATIAALLFPDWTMYPIMGVMSLMSFSWHALQLMLPLCMLIAGELCPAFRDVWKSILMLAAFAIPVYLFDRATSCNYWFLLQPVPGTPLETLFRAFGEKWYLLAYAGVAVAVIFLTQGVISVVRKVFDKPSERGIIKSGDD
ncbi:MAG: YwaF family protein [Lachnospiraceae bacterium]|nr:YwaF family protein [Lachnospiraceae bacterium]